MKAYTAPPFITSSTLCRSPEAICSPPTLLSPSTLHYRLSKSPRSPRSPNLSLDNTYEVPVISSDSSAVVEGYCPTPVALSAPAILPTAKELFRNPKNDTRKRIIVIAITLVVDVAFPIALYFILKTFIAPVWALLAAGGPALLSVIVKLIWKRQIDVIGVLVFGAFGISAIIAIVTDDARVLVFEKSIVTAVLGVVFLVTLIPFPVCWKRKSFAAQDAQYEHDHPGQKRKHVIRPFLFYAGTQLLPLGTMDIEGSGVEIDKFEWLWVEIPRFRKAVRHFTLLWGIGLLIEFAGRLIMVLSSLTLNQVVIYANVFFGVVIITLVLVSLPLAAYSRRKVFADVDAWIVLHYTELRPDVVAKPARVQSPVEMRD